MTQTLAQQHELDPLWRIAFARQARLFAERFPQESSRAAVGLASAGRHCDTHGDADEARLCFEVLSSRFPDSPFAEQCAGAHRRLELVGQPLKEFGGQTLDGGLLDLNAYAGKPLLIIFWSSTAPQFEEHLTTLTQALGGPGAKAVQVVGVNLDTEEQAVKDFLQQHQFHCPHVFYADPSLRGDKNLVADYYGVTTVPSYCWWEQTELSKACMCNRRI
jgi:peroxiredoxin